MASVAPARPPDDLARPDRRFLDARPFERLFTRTVALCSEHGLIDGTHLSVDVPQAEADAALTSLASADEPAASTAARRTT